MERWSDTVLRIAWTWTGSVHDAQDICQTVLLKLLTSPRRFDEEPLERAWVIRVAVNCCKDWKKSAWVRRRLPLEAAAHAAVHLPELGRAPCWRRCRPCRTATVRRCICGITRDMSRRRSGR